ncbi:TPA: LPXTG cell wall anchor domain-containing protein, partial [Bacillus cereus]|nr:LPXTG cell wall anchor domain-containing protein [Bacillus cereus]
PTEPTEPSRQTNVNKLGEQLPSTGGQLSIAPYLGGIILLTSLLFMVRSRKNQV